MKHSQRWRGLCPWHWFEESETNTNINMYDDSTTNMIFDQSSINR